MKQIESLMEYIRCISDERYEPYELQQEYIEGEYEYKKEEEPEWLEENNINDLEGFQSFGDYAVYQHFWDFFEEDIENLELENIRIDTKERTLGIKIVDFSGKYYFANFKIKGIDGDDIRLGLEHGDTFCYNPKTNKIGFEDSSYFEGKNGDGISFGILEPFLKWRAKKRLKNILSILSNFDLTITYLANSPDKIVAEAHNGDIFEFYKKESSFVMETTSQPFPELIKYVDKKIACMKAL